MPCKSLFGLLPLVIDKSLLNGTFDINDQIVYGRSS